MNILYLCHRIPYPPRTGDKVRSFHQIRHLARSHRIALACFADERSDLEHIPTLAQWCASVDVVYRSRRAAKVAGLKGLWTGRSLAVTAFESRELARRVAARTPEGGFDAIVAFTVVMAPYAEGVPAKARLVDFVDMDSEKWRLYAERLPWPVSWIYRLEAGRLGAFEDRTARSWDRTVLVSEREASVLRPRVPGCAISILSNGVDLEFFTPNGAPRDPTAAEIVFTGVMDYLPNADAAVYFCDEILPRIRLRVPEARFAIVGRNPTRDVLRLAERPGVVVTGTVPDVRDYVRGAAVSVAPLRIARGVQNKILESMAMGIPVVTTSGACQGVGAKRPDGITVADEPAEFADAVVRLLGDAERRRSEGAAARAYVERNHRWDLLGAKLEAMLEELVKTGSSKRE